MTESWLSAFEVGRDRWSRYSTCLGPRRLRRAPSGSMPIGTGWAEHSWLGRGLPQQDQVWVEARRRFRLSHAQVQMARELGMNPKKLGKLANDRQEPWKAPLPQ